MTDNQQLKFGFTVPVNKIYALLRWIVVINIVFLIGSALHHTRMLFPGKYTIQLFMAQFNFALENVAAAWYSSMLFFTTGLMAAVCCWADIQRSENKSGRILSFGWIIMAGIFIMLSFDEMGSFHEMIGETSLFKKAGGGKSKSGWYLFYGLIGVVAVFMLLFFWTKFRKNKMTLLLTIIGVLLFVSNPFQEKFEIWSWRSSADPSQWRRPVVFLLMEEGSEIFASFCFLYSFTVYAIGATTVTDTVKGKLASLYTSLPRYFILYIIALAAVLGIVMVVIHLNTWNFERDDNGIPQNWPPAAGYFVGFLGSLYLYFSAGKNSKRYTYLLLALTALLVSIYYGGNIYGYFHEEGLFSRLPFVMLAAVTITALISVKNIPDIFVKFLFTAWAFLMIISVYTNDFYPAAFGYIGAVSLLLALYSHFENSGITAQNT